MKNQQRIRDMLREGRKYDFEHELERVYRSSKSTAKKQGRKRQGERDGS